MIQKWWDKDFYFRIIFPINITLKLFRNKHLKNQQKVNTTPQCSINPQVDNYNIRLIFISINKVKLI